MGGGHGHGGDVTLTASPRTRAVLGVLVALLGALAVAAVVALWPDREALELARPADPYTGVTFLSGEVISTVDQVCEGAGEDRRPDGSIPAEVACVTGTVRLSDGSDVEVPIPPQVKRAGLDDGDRVRLARYPPADGQPEVYAWVDHDRRLPLGLVGLAFAIGVVAVARFKGLAALAGLGIAYPVITLFMLPAVRAGENPVAVALSGSAVIMIVVLYLAHGVSAKTTVALLGTLTGLAATGGLAWWVTTAADLDGLSSEENYQLSNLTTGAGLGGLVLCGVIIAGLGVLNDVTIAQASSVWELRALAPDSSTRTLFRSGMRIGRDHLASTVYTIAFAYAGAALPTLLLIDLYQQPLGEVLNGGELAEEIVRTCVGALGLVLTIPLTTAIAAVTARSLRPAHPGGGRGVPVRRSRA